MAHYKKDDSDQWWYIWGKSHQNKQRTYLFTCDECGKEFPRKKYLKKSDNMFCGKSCSGKFQSKNGLNCTAKGKNSPHWRGGIRKRKQYIAIYTLNHPHSSDGYVLEHRLVMEKYLKRYLESHEYVHHIDGNPINNDISNLKLMTRSQHASHHNKDRLRDKKSRFI